jgi:hypothetical protein
VHIPPTEHGEFYTPQQTRYMKTYNKRMWEELHRRFGRGFFDALWNEAQKLGKNDEQDDKNKPESTQS